jgi:hypothetical protein
MVFSGGQEKRPGRGWRFQAFPGTTRICVAQLGLLQQSTLANSPSGPGNDVVEDRMSTRRAPA